MSRQPRFAILATAAFAAVALAGASIAAEPATLKMGSISPAMASQVVNVYEPWVKRMEADAGGTLDIQVFHGGSLVRALDKQYEALHNRMQDIATVVTSYTEKLFPDFGLFSLPLMFRGAGADEGSYVAWKLYEKGMIRGLDQVHVVAVFTNDNSGLHFNAPIRKIEDIKGMKIRTTGPGEAEVIEIMGGAPVAVSISQVAESLHRGVINGTLTGWSALNSFRITPLIKSSIDMPFGVRSLFLAFNKEAYTALPETARKAVDRNAGLALARKFGDHWAEEGRTMREDLAKKHDVIRPSEDELRTVWRLKLRHIQQAWIDEDKAHRQKLYDEAQKLIAEFRQLGG